jgi:hypothetical protein
MLKQVLPKKKKVGKCLLIFKCVGDLKTSCDILWPWWAILILREACYLWVGKFNYNVCSQRHCNLFFVISFSGGHCKVNTCYLKFFPPQSPQRPRRILHFRFPLHDYYLSKTFSFIYSFLIDKILYSLEHVDIVK